MKRCCSKSQAACGCGTGALPCSVGLLNQIRLQRSSIQRKKLSKSEYSDALIWPDAPQLAFAHSDWSGYSVFEEAFTLGHAAGAAIAERRQAVV